MNTFIRIAGVFLAIIILTGTHIGLSFILPYPLAKINILFAVLIMTLLWKNSGTVVWLAFFSHLLLELYATTPFGVILFSATVSMLLSYWLYQDIFTNRSWFSAIALTIFTLVIYRAIYLSLLAISSLFNLTETIPWKPVATTFFWELFFTTIFIAIVYFLLSRFFRRFKGAIIETPLFKL